MNKPLADNLLEGPAMMIALRDFLREWFPKAQVYRLQQGMVRAETGGLVGYNSDFETPPPMTLRAVYQLAQNIRADWEERLKNA